MLSIVMSLSDLPENHLPFTINLIPEIALNGSRFPWLTLFLLEYRDFHSLYCCFSNTLPGSRQDLDIHCCTDSRVNRN